MGSTPGTPDGLLSSALLTEGDPSSPPQPPTVQLHDFNTVCLAVAPVLGRYRFASVVANISCSAASGVEERVSGDVITSRTVQLDLECSLDGNSGEAVWGLSVSGVSLASPAHATLDTPLRENCASCISPQLPQPVDPLSHCLGIQSRQVPRTQQRGYLLSGPLT